MERACLTRTAVGEMSRNWRISTPTGAVESTVRAAGCGPTQGGGSRSGWAISRDRRQGRVAV
jgi:hypothetical protein